MHVGAEEKISCAGPAPAQTTEGGSSKKGKLPAKKSAVASSIKGPEPSAESTAARSDNTSLLQRKIQQLKEQSRPFDVYTTGSNNELLLANNPSMNDTSVISYDSKGPVQNFNCSAKNRTDDSPITCRHLAYAFAIGGFGLKTNVPQSEPKEPGGKFNAVGSIDNIQNNAAIKTDQQLEKTPVCMGIPKVALYFDGEHFGQALYDVWMNKGVGDQDSHGKPSQTWLLNTENHYMAIKLKPTSGSAIKIEWYDPNNTTIVRRVTVLNEEILLKLTLNQFISTPDQKIYAIDQGRAGVLMGTDAVDAQNDSDATVLAALTPSLLNLLMRHGQLNSSFTDSLKMKLSEVRSDNLRELIVLLCAKCGKGTPGLFTALQWGYQEAISAYVEVIKQFRDIIEPEVIKELLAAKRKDGTSGLCMALKNGHQEAVRAYVEGIKQFRDIIEPEVIKELLAAKSGHGTPGLFVALEKGQPEAIVAYFESIKLLRGIIGPEVMRELFAAKRGDGVPGLFIALQEGLKDYVSAYVKGIKQFQDIIEPKAMEELLAAKAGDGTPGLFIALQNGQHEAIIAYFESIKLLRGIIGTEVMRELFAAKRGDGVPGLFIALQEGIKDSVSAFVKGITQFEDIIEPKAIEELLAAKVGDGTPGLFMALKNGHREAISAYLEGI